MSIQNKLEEFKCHEGLTNQPSRHTTSNQRILEILAFIGTDGLASLENLHRKFWPGGKSIQTCRRYLSQLEKIGWLKSYFIHVCKPGQLVFTVTSKGAKENFSQAARKNLMIGLPANQEIKQQMLAQQTRLFLEEQLAAEGKQIIEWLNERQLRRETIRNIKSGISTLHSLNDIADARMTIQSVGGQIYRQEIEVDGEYYGQMLKAKIEAYSRKGLPTLWVTTRNRAERIKDEISRAKATNITMLILENETKG
jgi:hypothetical protein